MGGGGDITPLNFPTPVNQAIALNTSIPMIIFPLIPFFSITIIETKAPAPSKRRGFDKSPN